MADKQVNPVTGHFEEPTPQAEPQPLRPGVFWNPVSNQHEFPMETIYADRQRERDQAAYEGFFGTTADTSQQGLDQAAQGAEQMPGKGGAGAVRPPLESASEAVRNKVQALADQPLLYKAADTALRTVTGDVVGLDDLTPEGIQRFNNREHGFHDFSKMADPLGNTAEAVARENVKRQGGTDEQADLVAGVVSLAAGVLFPMPGKGGKFAERAAGAAEKGTAMVGPNMERVGASAAVKNTLKNMTVFTEEKLAASRKTVTHAETIAASQGAPKPGTVRLYRAEGPSGAGPEGKNMFGAGDTEGLFFGTREGAQSYVEQLALDNVTATVKYLDVPATDAAKYKVTPKKMGDTLTPGGEWIIPHDVASGRKSVADLPKPALTLEEAINLNPEVTTLTAPQMTALRDHYNAAATYLTDLAKRAAAGDTAAATELPSAFVITGKLAVNDESVARNVARGLESRKILSQAERATIDIGDISKLSETLGDAAAGIDPQVLAQRLLALNKTQRETFVTHAVGYAKAGQSALYEAWINALLSGPQTHAANILSNAATAVWAPGERFMASLWSAAEGAVTGDRSVYVGESVQMFYGLVEGAKDGIRILGKALKEGVGGAGQKVERPPAITPQAFGLNPEGFVGSAVDYMGAIVRTPTRGLIAEDEFFKAVNYRMQLRALAYREASQEGLTGSKFSERMAQIIAEPPTAVKAAADQFALAQTFNQSLDNLGPMARGLGKGAQAFADNVPMGRIILPFVRTPANILNYASERTPILNLIATNIAHDITKGTPEQRAVAMGKAASGGLVSAAVASYCASPINADNPVPFMTAITGEGPTDARQRGMLQSLGWRPYSQWTGSEYVSYKRMDPLGTVLGIVCTATEMIGQLPEQGASEIASATSIAVGKAMLSKTFLTGLSDWLEAQQGHPEKVKKFWESLASSGVPAVARQTTRTLDPTRREMDGLFDHWRSGLPGYDGAPVLNLWGDPVMLDAGVGPDIVSPLRTAPHNPDAVTEWLLQNRVPVQGAPKVVGGTPPAGTQLQEPTAKVGIKLTGEEHHRLSLLMGKGGEAGQLDGGPDLGGLAGLPPLKDAIREIIAGPGTGGPDGSKADLIRERVQLYKRAAVMQLRKESPMLDEHLAALEKQRIDLKVNEPAPRSGPPGLMDALKGIIPTLGR